MASNKHVDLSKIDYFVGSKCYPEDISKDKGNKANFTKSYKDFKIADRRLAYKSLNCKPSKPFKCFNQTMPYSFLFIRKFKKYLFPKRALIYQVKRTPGSIYFLGNYDWGIDISL